jgi:thioredoxin 1
MSDASQTLDVVCLCAQWCGICRAFRPEFESLRISGFCFYWVDIEEHDEALADIDVETFPTVIIADRNNRIYFAGAIEPPVANLRRVLSAVCMGGLISLASDGPWQHTLAQLGAFGVLNRVDS